jgi:dienelactone hydrolase
MVHGAGSTRSDVLGEAVPLVRNGDAVVLIDSRGHGDSGGTAMDFGWYGDLDITAAVDFLAARPEIDPTRIGVLGFSMGGEEALGAAAADPRIAAVVAEGATARQSADKRWYSDVYGWRGWLQEQFERIQFGITDFLTDASPPTPLRSAVAAADDTEFLLITAGEVADEQHAARDIRAAAPDRVSVWNVEGADHTGGHDTLRDEWERRVIEFFDENLR